MLLFIFFLLLPLVASLFILCSLLHVLDQFFLLELIKPLFFLFDFRFHIG